MKNPKKILIFSVAYYPRFVGGAEVAVKEITDRLSPDEYEFHLITLRLDAGLPKEEKIGNVFVYRVGFSGEMRESADSLKFPLHYNKYLFPFISAWKGLSLASVHHFDATWSIMANYSGFGALFFKLCHPRIPFLLTLQEGDPIEYIKRRVGLMYPVFRLIFKKADALQAISRYLAEFGTSMGFRGVPIVVPNAVDIKKFDIEISHTEHVSMRESLGLSESDVALVTTSRLVVKNGVGDVIDALAHLPSNVKFVICGEGYLEERLKLKAKSLKVEDRILWKGYVPHDDMPKILKACDIFIRPSLSEGFGNSFIEAMACKIPVIATPVGGIVDFLFDDSSDMSQKQTGYFCDPEDSDSIARTVKRIMEDSQKHIVLENAYIMVKKNYGWEGIVLQMKDILDRF